MRNSQRGSATLLLAIGIATLAGTIGVTVISTAVLQSRNQTRVINSEESFYSGEISAVQLYERKKSGLPVTPGETSVTLDNRSNVAVAGTTPPTYDPATYTAGTPVPLSLTSQFEPQSTLIRRYSGTNLKSRYTASGVFGSSYCGKMNFAMPFGPGPSSVCLYKHEPVTASLTAMDSLNPAPIPYGHDVTLAWSSQFAEECHLDNGIADTSTAGTASVPNLTTFTSFTVTCTRSGGLPTDTASATVTVSIIPEPETEPTVPDPESSLTVDIKANDSDSPSPVDWEEKVVLSWTSLNASSCEVTSNHSPDKFSGTENPGVFSAKLTGATTYTITCTGPGGTVRDSVCIGTRSPPPITFEEQNPYEGKAISTQWQATHHVVFSILGSSQLPVLARVAEPGEQVGDPRAWLCAKCPGSKNENRLWNESDYAIAGKWALTLPDATHNPHPKPLLVTYEFPVSRISGYIADIDDEETWTITPLDSNNVPLPEVWSRTAPKGYGENTSNGEMVPFEITRPRADIKALVIDGAKGKKFFGFGFDRFSTGDSFCGP